MEDKYGKYYYFPSINKKQNQRKKDLSFSKVFSKLGRTKEIVSVIFFMQYGEVSHAKYAVRRIDTNSFFVAAQILRLSESKEKWHESRRLVLKDEEKAKIFKDIQDLNAVQIEHSTEQHRVVQ